MDKHSPVRLEKKHPLAIRWFHWINFPTLFIMIWSGLLIYWSNDVYAIKWQGKELFHFFPTSIYDKFNLSGRLAEGMGWHFMLAWVFIINGLCYAAFLIFSGEWREIVPQKGTLKNALHTVLHDLRIRKDPPIHGKFNGAQQIAYTSIVFMGGLAAVSGIAIFKPVQSGPLVYLLGGYDFARIIHFALVWVFLSFFLVHVGQVIKAGWNNFRAMVTGYELVKEESHEPTA